MRAVSQAFGRFMEGGVLRKEDEAKYRLMFPKISDTEDAAKEKLKVVSEILKTQYAATRNALRDSGYDISGLEDISADGGAQEVLTATNNQTGERIASKDGGKTWQPLGK